MPGFFRSLAKAAIDGYQQGKQQRRTEQTQYEQQYGQQQYYQSPPQSPMNDHQHQYQPPPQNTYQHTYQTPPQSPPEAQQSSYGPPLQEQTHSQASQQQPQSQVESSPALQVHTSPSPGCNGFDPLQSSCYYCTTVAPDLAFCPSCYERFVSKSPFANRFRAVPNISNGGTTCDMPLKAVRDAWKNACVRAEGAPAADQEVWFQQFGQQYVQISAKIVAMMSQVASLKEQVQIGQIQVEFQQKSAMMQISHGHAISCSNAMNLDSYNHRYDGGSLIAAQGSNRFADTMQMSMKVHQLEYELKKTSTEFAVLTGCGADLKPTWE